MLIRVFLQVLNQVQLSRPRDRLGAVAYPKFTDNVADMLLGGGHCDDQFSSDFLVGGPLCQ